MNKLTINTFSDALSTKSRMVCCGSRNQHAHRLTNSPIPTHNAPSPTSPNFYFTPDMGIKYCSERVCRSVCLYVCVCLSARISKKHVEISIKFSEHDKCGSGSVLLWGQCNMLLHSVQKKTTLLFCSIFQTLLNWFKWNLPQVCSL